MIKAWSEVRKVSQERKKKKRLHFSIEAIKVRGPTPGS